MTDDATRNVTTHGLELTIPRLVLLGEASLMRPSQEVDPATVTGDEFRSQLIVLKAAMAHYGGIGIAAPQIGWDARVFCLGLEESQRYPDADPIPFSYWINPRIEAASESTCWTWEGCLSVPGMRGWVQRPTSITVVGLDQWGQEKRLDLSAFAARVFQHEFDHLDGILYPQRVEDLRFLVSDALISQRQRWAPDYPSEAARTTPFGDLSAAR